MPFVTSIIFSIRQIWHSKKQTIRLGMGVTAAMVVLLTINLGISISQQKTFLQVVDSTAFDFTITLNKPQEASLLYDMLQEKYEIPVTNVIGINNYGSTLRIGDYTWLSKNATNYSDPVRLDPNSCPILSSISDNDFKNFVERSVITSLSHNYTLSQNQILIDNFTLQQFNLKIGDSIFVHNQIEVGQSSELKSSNYTSQLQIGGIIGLNRSSARFLEFLYPNQQMEDIPSQTDIFLSSPIIFVDYTFLFELLESLNPSFSQLEQGFTTFIVFLDRPVVLFPYDVAGTISKLNYFEKRFAVILRQEFPDVSFSVLNRMAPLLQRNQAALDFLRIILMLASLPAILIALYFAKFSSQLNIHERHHDIGILKSRGATPRQIRVFYVLEGLIIGGISGMITIPCAILFTTILFSIPISELLSLLFPIQNPSTNIGIVVSGSILAGSILGIAINWFISREVIQLDILGSIRKTPTITSRSIAHKNDRTIIWPLIIVIFSFTPIISLITENWLPSGLFQPLQYLFVIINSLGLIIAPVLPIILPWAFIRILSARIGHMAGLVRRLVNPFLKEASVLVHQSFRQNIRIGTNLSLITSLTLAFTILPLFLSQNLHTFAIDSLETEIGADLTLEGSIDQLNHSSETILKSILPSSALMTSVLYVRAPYPSYDPSLGSVAVDTWVVGINASSYTEIVTLKHFHSLTDRSISELDNNLETLKEAEAVIDNSISSEGIYQIGDQIFITPHLRNKTDGSSLALQFNFTITDIKRLLPGIDGSEAGSSKDIAGIIVNLNTLIPWIEKYGFPKNSHAPRYKFLVKLPKDFSSDVLLSLIYTTFGYDIKVRNLAIEKNEVKNLTLGSLNLVIQALEGEAVLIGLILMLNVTVVVSLTLHDRELEFGVYRSRGIQTHQLFVLIFAQILSLALTGIILGALAGWISGFLLTSLTLSMFNPTEVPIPNEFPPSGFLLIIGVAITFVLIAIYGQNRMLQKPIIEQIRLVNK
ncbi:MAG: FtsX-like permease family protein [Candidatus Hodarchaeota archaeon]